MTDTPIIRTADKFRTKINYRHLTEINSRYYGLSLQKTLTQGPTVSAIKGVDCTYLNIDFIDRLKKNRPFPCSSESPLVTLRNNLYIK